MLRLPNTPSWVRFQIDCVTMEPVISLLLLCWSNSVSEELK